MKTTETHEFYPVNSEDNNKIIEILNELREVLLERSDGVSIVIERTKEFPQT